MNHGDRQNFTGWGPEAVTTESHKNPNTRTRYFFPKDARRYVGLVASLNRRTWNAQICESGHDDCALWDRGPCEHRVSIEYKTDPDDPIWDDPNRLGA